MQYAEETIVKWKYGNYFDQKSVLNVSEITNLVTNKKGFSQYLEALGSNLWDPNSKKCILF